MRSMQGGKGLQPYDEESEAKDSRNSRRSFRFNSLPEILKYVRWHKTALEVGCGNGRIARCLAPSFDAVVGIDPYVDPDLSYMQMPNVEYQKCTWQEFESTGWFDLILFWGSFYLFADEGADTLSGCAAILQSDGAIVIADDLRRNTDRDVDPIDDGLTYSLTALRRDLREVHEFIQDNYLRVTVLKK